LWLPAPASAATLTWVSAQGTMYLDNMNGNPLPAILFMSTKDTSSAYEPSTTFDNQVQTFRANMSDRINQPPKRPETNPKTLSIQDERLFRSPHFHNRASQ